jgi:site-specific recombinase XerD
MLNDFREYLLVNPLPSRKRQGASEKTIQGYVQDVSIFLRWWKGTFGNDLTLEALNDDPYLLNRKAIQDFLSWLQTTKGYAAATVLRYSSSLTAFAAWLEAIGALRHNPTLGLRLPVAKISEPRGLTDAQRARFEAVFQSPWQDKVTKRKRTYETQAPLRLARDKAIALLMLYAGPRVEEVERLNLGDIEIRPRSGVMRIRQGKGFRERDVPLPQAARDAISAWLDVRAELPVEHEALFVELRQYRRLSVRSMQSIVTEAGQRAGLDRLDPPVTVTPHLLRHTYAYMLRQAGVSVEVRAEMSGHAIQTAMRYGRPKTREKELAADELDKMVAG